MKNLKNRIYNIYELLTIPMFMEGEFAIIMKRCLKYTAIVGLIIITLKLYLGYVI